MTMIDRRGYLGEAQIYIDAPPETVYELISDVTRVGEWSPEGHRCEWLDGVTEPAVGVRFRGHNGRKWLRWGVSARITEAEPGKVFAFGTEPFSPINKSHQTLWRYELEATGSGTTLKESFHALWVLPLVVLLAFGGKKARLAQLEQNLETTLARIKAAAEAS